LQVVEQNYRYDLLTPSKLLEKYVGKAITVYRYNEKTGTDEKKTAEVLSVEGGVTLRIDGEVVVAAAGSSAPGPAWRYAFQRCPARCCRSRRWSGCSTMTAPNNGWS
jgi:hypothetical protein